MEIENCETIDIDSNCILCKTQFYISNSKCKAIGQLSLIDFCIYYQDTRNCLFCELGYFLFNGECVKINARIENCLTQLDQQHCLVCDDNFIVSYDRLFCEESPLPNCKYFSHIKCRNCSPNSRYNPNFYS